MPTFTRATATLIVAVAALSVLACGGSDDSETATPTSAVGATATTAPAQQSPTAAAGAVADEPVGFSTSDGVTIRGHLYSTAGPKRRVVILAHDFPRDQIAWTAFARELAAQGIAALTFDFRGFGETGGAKDVPLIHLDLEAAANFIEARDYAQVYLVGASMGGTAAIKVAARLDFAGVVTVSAPTSFRGLDARSDIVNVEEPTLFLASRDDGDAPAAAQFFAGNAPGVQGSALFEGAAHGTAILQSAAAPALKQLIIEFLSQ